MRGQKSAGEGRGGGLKGLVHEFHKIPHLDPETVKVLLGVFAKVLLAEGATGYKGLCPGLKGFLESRFSREPGNVPNAAPSSVRTATAHKRCSRRNGA